MAGHAGLRALLRGLLAWPRRSPDGSWSLRLRYRPSCMPGGMTAVERGLWAEKIDAAQRVTFADGVRESGCDWWTDEDSPVPFLPSESAA